MIDLKDIETEVNNVDIAVLLYHESVNHESGRCTELQRREGEGRFISGTLLT